MNDESATHQLSALAVEQQQRFDALAAEQERSYHAEGALRDEMFRTLAALRDGLDAMLAMPDAASRDRALAERMNGLAEFDRLAVAYSRARFEAVARSDRMADVLAAFMKTRSQLLELGCAAPELIQHESSAAVLSRDAHEANRGERGPA